MMRDSDNRSSEADTLEVPIQPGQAIVYCDRIAAILGQIHEIVPAESLLSDVLVELNVQVQRTPGQSSFILRKRDLPSADY